MTNHRRYSAAMGRALKLHPESRCAAVAGIAVEAARPRPGALHLRYLVTGETGGLSLPPAAAPARAEGLWRHTCFEAFVRAELGAGPGGPYYEFNLAPSTRWAAYRFGGYRDGMSPASELSAPAVETASSGAGFELRTALELERLPDLPADLPWRLGLSAVIEESGGRLSYWALAHPPGAPDFHHADCFALELPVV